MEEEPFCTAHHLNHIRNNSLYVFIIDLSGVEGFEPVTISAAPTQIDLGDVDLVITGTNFEAVQGAGNVYVSDMSNHRVQVFTTAGTYVTQWGSLGGAADQFQFPRGVAANS